MKCYFGQFDKVQNCDLNTFLCTYGSHNIRNKMIDTDLETAEKCSFTPRPPSRNEGEGLPKAAANVALAMAPAKT